MSFPRYPKYKPSGVEWLGDVPEHWPTRMGRRVFAQKREPAEPFDEQLAATQKHGVIPQRLFMELEDQKVTLALKGLEAFKHVELDDFVISLRSFQGGIEHSYYTGCVSPAYTVLRATGQIVAGYWKYLLKSAGYVSALQAATDGIRDGKSVSYQQFGEIALPVPSVEEQTAIAEFLDRETGKIDELVAEQRRLIELLKEKRQAVISHAVTKGLNPNAPTKPSGIEWLGDVPKHWDVLSLRRVASSVQTGGTPSSVMPADEVPEGLVWYTPGDFCESLRLSASARMLAPEVIASGEAKIFPPRSVLVVSIGATLGKVGFADGVSAANQQINAVVPNEKIDGYFCAYSLSSKAEVMRFVSNASTIGIMNQEKTKDIWLAVPPMSEQHAITEHLDTEAAKLDALTAEAERAIELLQERRTALISAAVTGKIDVRGLREEGPDETYLDR